MAARGRTKGRRLRSASAGATAAVIWALQEPVDQRLLGCDYSDVAVLGKAVTPGAHWRATGLALHSLNGAAFGLAFHEARRAVPVGSRKLALGMALTEHVCLYPLCALIDRYHPARGEAGIPRPGGTRSSASCSAGSPESIARRFLAPDDLQTRERHPSADAFQSPRAPGTPSASPVIQPRESPSGGGCSCTNVYPNGPGSLRGSAHRQHGPNSSAVPAKTQRGRVRQK